MTGMGLGSANPATPPPSLPLGSSTWAPGAWFDLIAVPGPQGDPIVAGVPSLAGSNVATPQSNPLVNNTPIGGQRGCRVIDTGVANTEPLFRCDALSQWFTPAALLTVGGDFRPSKAQQHPLFVLRSSTGGVTDQWSVYIIGERLAVLCQAPSTGGLVTFTGTIPINYDYHRWAVRCDGTRLRSYVDGVLDLDVPFVMPTLSVNRCAWLGAVASLAFGGATGYARRLYFSPSDVGSSGIATVDAYLVGQDYTKPPTDPSVKEFLFCGASITVGSSANITGAGYRGGVSQYIIDNRLSWRAIGDRPQGFVPTRETPSLSGQAAAAIAAMVATWATPKTCYVGLDFGNAEINAGQNASQVLTAIRTNLHNARASLYAQNPNAYVSVYTILPYFEAPFNAVAQAVNASLPSEWNLSDAEFPGSPKLLRWDGNTAIGGPSYVQANYPIGDDHPNQTGYDLLIPALLGASNASGDVLSNVLDMLSPT